MPRHKFTHAERHAVYTVHGEKCYMCGAMLTMMTCEVDHIIPVSLKDRPEELTRVLEELGLDETFDLNSHRNWMPACRRCNKEKSDLVFKLAPMIKVLLQKAEKKARKAEEIEQKLVTDRDVAKALNTLHRRVESDGELSDEVRASLMPLIELQRESREEAFRHEPVHVSAMYDVGDENQWVLSMERLARDMAKNLNIEILLLLELHDDVHVTARAGPDTKSASVAVFDIELRKIARGRGKSIQISWA